MASSNRAHEQVSGEDCALVMHQALSAASSRAHVSQSVPSFGDPVGNNLSFLWGQWLQRGTVCIPTHEWLTRPKGIRSDIRK